MSKLRTGYRNGKQKKSMRKITKGKSGDPSEISSRSKELVGVEDKDKFNSKKKVAAPPLRLYFVAHADGENYDLFVWSETLDTVADHWRSYYELDADERPDRICEVSIAAPRRGPVQWHHPGHVHCVFGDKQAPAVTGRRKTG
jgi:hypothetical protein